MRRFTLTAPVRRGFTLVEMLVVIGIIGVLITILVPVIGRARKSADRRQLQAMLNTIGTGLEEYKKVYNDYPRPNLRPVVGATSTIKGATYMLYDALCGSTQYNGKTAGPFLQPEKFVKAASGAILDPHENEIQYYPRYADNVRWSSPINVNTNNVLLGSGSYINPGDVQSFFRKADGMANLGTADGVAHRDQTLYMLGLGKDGPSDGVVPWPSPVVGMSEKSLVFRGSFILVSAGSDRAWGMQNTTENRSSCDDVYNFER